MTLAIIASMPVDSRFVPSCLESIIDKRVNRTALNLLERLVNWICSWFYFPYNTLYNAKMARTRLFSDGTVRLFDSTKQGIAGIEKDSVSLHGRKVHFSPNPIIDMVFARQANTDYVVVKDDERRRAGWYQIIEQEISRPGNRKPMEKTWMINTNRFYLFTQRDIKEAYLVEQPRAAL